MIARSRVSAIDPKTLQMRQNLFEAFIGCSTMVDQFMNGA